MISRAAESCFWLNRYLERIASLARLLEVGHAFQLDVDLRINERWRPLVIVVGQERDFEERTPAPQRDDGETVQRYLCFDEENPSSIRSSLFWARENARTIRETVSLEMWLTLNDLWLWFTSRAARRLYDSDRTAFYAHLRNQCALYHGYALETMLHEEAFRFMRLGSALERANQTARILDVRHHAIGRESDGPETADEAAQWLAVLRSCGAIEPFFKRPDNEISGYAVANFLLLDPGFPRSVVHNLHRVRNFLMLLRVPGNPQRGARSRQLIGQVIEYTESGGFARLIESGLHRELTWLVDRTGDLGEQIRADYFDPSTAVLRDERSPEAALGGASA